MKLLHMTVVLAAVECDETAVTALQGARELARVAGAKLHVVHVGPSNETQQGERKQAVTRLLEKAGLAWNEFALHLVAGDPANEIRALGDKLRADVIILGRRRGDSTDVRRLGSTALGVVTNSWAPCLILPGPMHMPLERVLVPLDLSDTSRGALVVALSWASALRRPERRGEAAKGDSVSLTALVVDSGARAGDGALQKRKSLNDELNRLRGDAGSWADVAIAGEVVVSNDVVAAIAGHASEHHSDLVVLGTRGLGLDAVGRLGSVSLGVTNRIAIPVLLVPPAVWTSYAKSE
jgi:nucleotide-binding universal stress UspA family protein